MSSFVAPTRDPLAGDRIFDEWFQSQVKPYWGESFGKGVLVLRLPEELCVSVISLSVGSNPCP
jgi:hypothetical protein